MKNIVKKIKSFFKWHRWPLSEDYPIKSVYEIGLYIVIFILCLWVYISIQQIPYSQQTINIQTIHYGNEDILLGCANIDIYIPNSYTFVENEHGYISAYCYMNQLKNSIDSAVIYRTDSVFIEKPFFIGNSLGRGLISFDQTDSLFNFYLSQLPDSLKDCDLPSIFYIKMALKTTLDRFTNEYGIHPWKYDVSANKFGMSRVYVENNCYMSESYVPNGSEIKKQDVGDGPYSRPKWNRLYDISQSYFFINLGGTMDGGRLSINFEGVTDFSNMYPEPDIKTMNSIIFLDKKKIQEIHFHGLQFHAKFPELESTQSVRLFFVSAFMSGLMVIFVTFLILSSYKIFKKNRETTAKINNNDKKS